MTSGYLFDTSVVSILAPGRSEATPAFSNWVGERDRQLFVSTTTVVEIQQGVARLIRNGSKSRATVIGRWLEDLLETTGSNTLPLSVEVARHAGNLSDFAYSIGRHPGLADILIAATAQVHGLTLLTRNVRHFEPLGIEVIDPLVTLPG